MTEDESEASVFAIFTKFARVHLRDNQGRKVENLVEKREG